MATMTSLKFNHIIGEQISDCISRHQARFQYNLFVKSIALPSLQSTAINFLPLSASIVEPGIKFMIALPSMMAHLPSIFSECPRLAGLAHHAINAMWSQKMCPHPKSYLPRKWMSEMFWFESCQFFSPLWIWSGWEWQCHSLATEFHISTWHQVSWG